MAGFWKAHCVESETKHDRPLNCSWSTSTSSPAGREKDTLLRGAEYRVDEYAVALATGLRVYPPTWAWPYLTSAAAKSSHLAELVS